MKKIKSLAWIFALLMAVGPLLHTGCGILNPARKDADGYYTAHYSCCGPMALERAFNEIYIKNGIVFVRDPHTPKEISRVIQDSGQKSKIFLSFFNRQAVCITWPSEIKAAAKHYGFAPITLKEMDQLDPEKDVALVLVHGSTLKGEWHWMCFPFYSIKSIEGIYGDNTKIKKIYLLKLSSEIKSGP